MGKTSHSRTIPFLLTSIRRQRKPHCIHPSRPNALHLALHHVLLLRPSLSLHPGRHHSSQTPPFLLPDHSPKLPTPPAQGRLTDLRRHGSHRPLQHHCPSLHPGRQPSLHFLRLPPAPPLPPLDPLRRHTHLLLLRLRRHRGARRPAERPETAQEIFVIGGGNVSDPRRSSPAPKHLVRRRIPRQTRQLRPHLAPRHGLIRHHGPASRTPVLHPALAHLAHPRCPLPLHGREYRPTSRQKGQRHQGVCEGGLLEPT